MSNLAQEHEQDIQALRSAFYQEIRDAEVVYEWRCILNSKVRDLEAFLMGLLITIFFSLAYWSTQDDALIIMWGIMMTAFIPAIYFLFSPKMDYHGKITAKGVIVYQTERVPEVFYKVTRGLAYIGIVVCILAVTILGPFALVGAGAMALMSVKMTGFEKVPQEHIMIFDKINTYEKSDDPDRLHKNNIEGQRFFSPDPESIGELKRTWKVNTLIKIYSDVSEFPEIDRVLRKYINVVN